MKIIAIKYPTVIMDNGEGFDINQIKGSVRIGCEVDDDLNVTGNSADPDCVGGACPIK